MNKDKDKACGERLSATLEDFTDAVAEVLYRKGYKEIVTFDEITKYAIDEKKDNPEVAAFVVSVKKNYDPRNKNDKLVIIQGLLDAKNKPVTLNGKESESRIIHAGTIDKKFMNVLNGAETQIIKL